MRVLLGSTVPVKESGDTGNSGRGANAQRAGGLMLTVNWCLRFRAPRLR